MEGQGVPAALNYGLDQISGVSTNSFSIVSSSAGDEVSSGGRFTFLTIRRNNGYEDIQGDILLKTRWQWISPPQIHNITY